MKTVDYVILGAGPSGLTLANKLLGMRCDSFVVLEKESIPGGLCRSEQVDGAALDIGGGHFLDDRNESVLRFIFSFLPRREWKWYKRKSMIQIYDQHINHPFESNIWQLSRKRQIAILESISKAGCIRGKKAPKRFSKWISWKLGETIARDYMLPYNRKLWNMDLDTLGTYWLYKLPSVSFKETMQSCLYRKPFGQQPAHQSFFYPKKYGYGRVWTNMGCNLGNRIRLNEAVKNVDIKSKTINERYRATKAIITTIPWTEWLNFRSLPESIRHYIKKLKWVGINVAYCPDNIKIDAHWIYVPDESREYHRQVLRHNFLQGANGYWTETNSLRSSGESFWMHRNEYAYPVNCLEKPDAIRKISEWAHSNRIYPLGRWGEWEHMNSDVAVQRAIVYGENLRKNER